MSNKPTLKAKKADTTNDEEVMEYKLSGGYIDGDGTKHSTFTIRELTGKDEEIISKPEFKTNPAKGIQTLLERCVTSIGTIAKEDVSSSQWKEIIENLYVGDQDIIIMEIRKQSISEEIQVSHQCPYCKTKLDSFISIEDDLERIEFLGQDNISFSLPKGYKDKKGVIHKDGVIRLPRGIDRVILAPVANKNLSKGLTLMLVRLCKFDDEYPITDDVIESLVVKDRRYLQEIIDENMFGIKTQVEITCSSCGEEFVANINSTNFI